MSAYQSWTIQCDRCGDMDGGDLSATTAQERRRELAMDGWHINLPGGRDLCDDCWNER